MLVFSLLWVGVLLRIKTLLRRKRHVKFNPVFALNLPFFLPYGTALNYALLRIY